MSSWKKAGLGTGAALVVGGVVAGGALTWAKSTAAERLHRRFETHRVELPVPFPLGADELEALRAERRAALAPDAPADADALAGVDLGALATERAITRGRHLAEARYGCADCHGKDFGGGTMIDAPAMGVLLGKNLTRGKGSAVADYTLADWDRLVRHGVKRDGTPTVMPAVDFFRMSDRELSDLITYLRALPPVDREVPEPVFGPVGYFLMATGKILLPAELLESHQAPHAVEPPAEAPTATFGRHLAQTCVGCHGLELAGGPIPGGDPSWPPARNLTPHADGLAGWSYQDFVKAMRQGVRRDGTPMQAPMSFITEYGKKMRDVELEALWAHLQAAPAKPSPAKK